MAIKITKAEPWAATIEDKAGGLSAKLARLADSGVDLEFCLARRRPDYPGTGVVFICPIKGAKQMRAAEAAGFAPTMRLAAVRVEFPNRTGSCAAVVASCADAGLNIRGMSGMTLGKNAILYLSFDGDADANKAMRAIRKIK